MNTSLASFKSQRTKILFPQFHQCTRLILQNLHLLLFFSSTVLFPEFPLDYEAALWDRITSSVVLHETVSALPCSMAVVTAHKREKMEISGILNIYCDVYAADTEVNYMIYLYRNCVKHETQCSE